MRLDKKESMARKILNYSNRTHIKAVSLLWFCTLHCLTFFPSQVAGLDPLMDDGIEFAKRLVKLGKQVTLDVVPHLPHGFLCLVRHPDTKDTIHTVLSRIKHGLEIPSSCSGTSEPVDVSTKATSETNSEPVDALTTTDSATVKVHKSTAV